MTDNPSKPHSSPATNRTRQSPAPNWLVVAVVIGVVAWSAWKKIQDQPPVQKPGPVTTDSPQSAPAQNGPPRIEVLAPEEQRNDQPVADASPPPAASRTEPPRPKPAAAPDRQSNDRPKAAALTEVRNGVFESPAGLVYKRGSAQGHRIDHVLEHARDDPSKPVHGVFEASRDEIFALIDEAWETAQTRGPPQVQKENEGDRTVYTVNLKRRIGYLGGITGNRKKHPPLTGIRIVVEGRDVITAFPVAP